MIDTRSLGYEVFLFSILARQCYLIHTVNPRPSSCSCSCSCSCSGPPFPVHCCSIYLLIITQVSSSKRNPLLSPDQGSTPAPREPIRDQAGASELPALPFSVGGAIPQQGAPLVQKEGHVDPLGLEFGGDGAAADDGVFLDAAHLLGDGVDAQGVPDAALDLALLQQARDLVADFCRAAARAAEVERRADARVDADAVLLIGEEGGAVEDALAQDEDAGKVRAERLLAFGVRPAGLVAVARLGRVAERHNHLAGLGGVEGHLGEEQKVRRLAVRLQEVAAVLLLRAGFPAVAFRLGEFRVRHGPLEQARDVRVVAGESGPDQVPLFEEHPGVPDPFRLGEEHVARLGEGGERPGDRIGVRVRQVRD